MDDRFTTIPVIDIYDWEAMVMEEAGYGEYIDNSGFFDLPLFCKRKGFDYLGVCHFLNFSIDIEGENGSYKKITRSSFNPNFYDRNFSQEVNAVRKEMAKAAIRLFDLGIAPEEFILKIYW